MTDQPELNTDVLALVQRAADALDAVRRACEEGEPAAARQDLEGIASAARDLELRPLADALAAIARAVESAAEPDALRPATLSIIADAATGAQELVESVSLGDLRASLEPELLARLRELAPAAEPTPPAAESSESETPADRPRFRAAVENVANLPPVDPSRPLDPVGALAPDPTLAAEPAQPAADVEPAPDDAPEPAASAAPDPSEQPPARLASAPNHLAAPPEEDRELPLDSAPNGFAAERNDPASDSIASTPNGFAAEATPVAEAPPLPTLDPNQPLDPAGGAAALDPSQPLDPTGGVVALDPNEPLDPTGGSVALDPNQPLDPTGGVPSPIAANPDDPDGDTWGSAPLALPPEQAELLLFMVSDVRRSMEEIEPILAEAREFTARQGSAARLSTIAEEMGKLNEFFSFRSFASLVELLSLAAARLGDIDDAVAPELFIRVRGIANLIDQYCSGLEVGMELSWPLGTLRRRLEKLLSGQALCEELCAWHRGDVERLLELDGVVEGVETPPNPKVETAAPGARASAVSASRPAGAAGEAPKEASVPSIRVSKDAIDSLLDLIRQLVLNKNQICALASANFEKALDQHRAEQLFARADEYARLVGLLQKTVTDTRVQPVGVLLERYVRAVRDAARARDKEIDLRVRGEDTLVDKFVLDAIAETLGRLLRHTAAHAIEAPAEREAAGKPAKGVISVSVEDRGSHTAIQIEHDGADPTREELLQRAAAFDHLSPAALEAMSDRQLALLQFEPWFADSDLAGARDAVMALGGTVDLVPQPDGAGAAIEILLPIKGAVIEAMTLRVADGLYAVPITAIDEIVAVKNTEVVSIDQRPAVRIRDAVHPLLDCREIFEIPSREPARDAGAKAAGGIAVVVRVDDHRFALRVDAVVGRQEAVIQTMDAAAGGREGPFLGAAIQDDGAVALVVDVSQVHGAAASA